MNTRNFIFERDPFSKNAQSISKYYHEVLLLLKFLQTKPHVRNMNNNYYDINYTVIKNRDEKEMIFLKNKEKKNDILKLISEELIVKGIIYDNTEAYLKYKNKHFERIEKKMKVN